MNTTSELVGVLSVTKQKQQEQEQDLALLLLDRIIPGDSKDHFKVITVLHSKHSMELEGTDCYIVFLLASPFGQGLLLQFGQKKAFSHVFCYFL